MKNGTKNLISFLTAYKKQIACYAEKNCLDPLIVTSMKNEINVKMSKLFEDRKWKHYLQFFSSSNNILIPCAFFFMYYVSLSRLVFGIFYVQHFVSDINFSVIISDGVCVLQSRSFSSNNSSALVE
jgi:hypothetical protein